MFAQGGMAELYFARSIGPEGFEKLVVLKKILPTFAENARFVRLFLDEAKLAASLDHPSIAHVYDLGRVDGNYFFTMEYVHGQDVRKILRRATRGDKMPIEHAVLIARNVAGALHYAHERRGPDGALLGIVHRDVSPSNIVVSYEGAVKLLDFGVAKAANSTVKTRTGTLKGKVAYMSPEQAKGESIDRRSDIFSTGIVMWEMVATQRLYKGDNDLATIQLIINQPPPPLATVRPECPAELDRIIQRALAQDPAKRYQTAQELQSDLDELARETKLNQSSIALSTHMTTLFAPEIEAWREAQGKGVSLADHIVAASANPPHVSSADDEDEDDDGDQSDGAVSSADEDERTERTEVPLPPSVAPIRAPTPAPVIARAPTPPPTRAPTPPPSRAPTPPPTRAPTPPPTRAPTPPPVAAAPAPAPKKKRKRAKEPQSWASEPSVVLDVALVVAIADVRAQARTRGIDARRRAGRDRSADQRQHPADPAVVGTRRPHDADDGGRRSDRAIAKDRVDRRGARGRGRARRSRLRREALEQCEHRAGAGARRDCDARGRGSRRERGAADRAGRGAAAGDARSAAAAGQACRPRTSCRHRTSRRRPQRSSRHTRGHPSSNRRARKIRSSIPMLRCHPCDMRFLALLLAITVLAPRAHAQGKLKPDAQVHLDAALKAYAAKDYDVAFREFDQAYAVDPNPALLYATAQALRHASKCAQAIDTYRRYLDTKPNDTQVAAAKTGITSCEDILKQSPPTAGPENRAQAGTQTRAQPDPETRGRAGAGSGAAEHDAGHPPAETPTDAAWYKRDPLADGLVVGGALGIGVGIVFLVKGSNSEHASQTDQFRNDFIHDLDNATSQARIGAVALTVGAAMAAGGVVIYVLRDHHATHPIVGGTDGHTLYVAGAF